MREEFHGDRSTETWKYKLLYGWGTINANVWLPSLKELVGIDTNNYSATSGCYASAMQDVPNVTPGNDNVDKNGGEQWAWLVPFNQSGGAAEIWRLAGDTTAWLRSPDKGQSVSVWAVTSTSTISWNQLVTASRAVHPAGADQPYQGNCLRSDIFSELDRGNHQWNTSAVRQIPRSKPR